MKTPEPIPLNSLLTTKIFALIYARKIASFFLEDNNDVFYLIQRERIVIVSI
jgi:hypothetical protein